MATENNVHAGHRQRMRARFESSPPTSFADHEILEMLLYYTNARGDTNEIAHALLERFGNVSAILEADPDRLKAIDGIGDKAAFFLSLLGEVAKRYITEKISPERQDTVLDTPDKIAAFMAPRFIGAKKELAYALLFDNSMRVIDFFPIGEGNVSHISISARSIAERAFTKGAAAVVLAHNHPGGVAVPSGEDIAMTHRIGEALMLLEIPLVEHFVFSDRHYAAILKTNAYAPSLETAASSLFQKLQKNFYQKKGEEK